MIALLYTTNVPSSAYQVRRDFVRENETRYRVSRQGEAHMGKEVYKNSYNL